MKQLKFRGDKTGDIKPGDVMGPDVYGQHHKVTSVNHHHGYTYVQTRRITAAGGQRIRYYGGVNNPEPPQYADDELRDEIEAQ